MCSYCVGILYTVVYHIIYYVDHGVCAYVYHVFMHNNIIVYMYMYVHMLCVCVCACVRHMYAFIVCTFIHIPYWVYINFVHIRVCVCISGWGGEGGREGGRGEE